MQINISICITKTISFYLSYCLLAIWQNTQLYTHTHTTHQFPKPLAIVINIFLCFYLQVSTINPKVYHTATFLGLLPAQLINVYLGSTLRSMHEVLNNHGTAITGYISFGVEVSCSNSRPPIHMGRLKAIKGKCLINTYVHINTYVRQITALVHVINNLSFLFYNNNK